MMVFLHLFNKDYKGVFTPLLFIGEKPLSYYLSLFCDACLPMYLFCSGYGLYISYKDRRPGAYLKKNVIRTKKLLFNYWMVLLLFPVIIGNVLGLSAQYPGSLLNFLMNFSTVGYSYNGSWWFLFTYILLAALSVPLFKVTDRYPFGAFLVFFILYCVGYFLKTRFHLPSLNESLNIIVTHGTNFLFALLQFMLGVYAYKYKVFTKFEKYLRPLKRRNFLLAVLLILLIILHGIFPTLFIAPFISFAFIMIFNIAELKFKFAAKFLDFFALHSTNIWLVHLFFVSIFFSDFVYGFKYVFIIYAVVLILSVFSSYIINLFNNRLQSLIR